MEKHKIHTIGILGGTGKEGKGLAYRWAKSGYEVIIGSRRLEKALTAAEEIKGLFVEEKHIRGMYNEDAAKEAELLVLTVPFSAHHTILEDLKSFLSNKILIDVTVPLVPPNVTRVQMPEAGSAALQAKQILGESVRVISAFQNISHENLLNDEKVECDVLVCGDDSKAKEIGLELVKDTGLIGWDAGPLDNSMVVEGLTSILIGINKKHKVRSSGIRITGVN